MLHLRFEGQSLDLSLHQLDLHPQLADREILSRLAKHLQLDPRKLQEYVVDRRPNGNLIIRPHAIYG